MLNYLLVLSAIIFLSACSGGTATNTSSSPQAAHSSAQAPVTFNSFTGNNLRLIGRFDTAEPGKARFSWPGSALEFRFEGTGARMALASSERVRFQVDVDGVIHDLWVDEGEASYSLASGLAAGEHQLRLTRLTESFAIVSAFSSDPQVDGTLLQPPAAPSKRLLVLGDSITAGYGDEGTSQSCHYSKETSNEQLAYAALAAKSLGADLHTIAWSGIGAWRSYGEKTPVNPSILVRQARTLANDENSRWNPAAYQPNAVLINIGTNDYWEGSASDDYRLAMIDLLNLVRTDYPGKPIYLILSPMLGNAARAAQQTVLQSLEAADVQLLDLGKIEASDGWGCDYHPNTITQARLGQALAQKLKTDLAW